MKTAVLICPDTSGRAAALYELTLESERYDIGPNGETRRNVFSMGRCLASSVDTEFVGDVAAFLCEVLETRAVPTVGEILEPETKPE